LFGIEQYGFQNEQQSEYQRDEHEDHCGGAEDGGLYDRAVVDRTRFDYGVVERAGDGYGYLDNVFGGRRRAALDEHLVHGGHVARVGRAAQPDRQLVRPVVRVEEQAVYSDDVAVHLETAVERVGVDAIVHAVQ